jgi:hypothetical protein
MGFSIFCSLLILPWSKHTEYSILSIRPWNSTEDQAVQFCPSPHARLPLLVVILPFILVHRLPPPFRDRDDLGNEWMSDRLSLVSEVPS